MSGWGGQRTGSRRRPSRHPSQCCTWLGKGWRRAPRSCRHCGGHTWKKPSCWSTGWVDQERRAEDAGNSTRRSHPDQQGETKKRGLCECSCFLLCHLKYLELYSLYCIIHITAVVERQVHLLKYSTSSSLHLRRTDWGTSLSFTFIWQL